MGGGLVFDEGINKFVHCPDDGYLYTLEQVGATTQFYVDRMALTGTGFPALSSSRGTNTTASLTSGVGCDMSAT